MQDPEPSIAIYKFLLTYKELTDTIPLQKEILLKSEGFVNAFVFESFLTPTGLAPVLWSGD